jgi:hypothetical protein
MNDFMEVEHGFECLNAAYKKHKADFLAAIEGIYSGFSGKLESLFNGWLPHFRSDTYITSFSEHDDDEDSIGRLSMWRAYGQEAGVAIIMRNGPFVRPTDALKAYASPVAYLTSSSFEQEFLKLLSGIRENIELLRTLGETSVLHHVFSNFRAAVLCTKHPGFREEREWRIIYSHTFSRSERILEEIVAVDETPQSICKIPLIDVPSEGLFGIEIPTLIDRVIIGPARFPFAIRDAFVALLSSAGMSDAAKRVIVSDIPLRT